MDVCSVRKEKNLFIEDSCHKVTFSSFDFSSVVFELLP